MKRGAVFEVAGLAFDDANVVKLVRRPVGDEVAVGQTLMIVEAMKTMNPIPAPKAGTVAAIMITDGHPVEFGEPLLIIE